MTSLYEIADEYRTILDSLEEGELDDAALERLDSVEHNLTEKATNVAAYVRNLETTAQAIKTAEMEMAKRRRAMEDRVKWLKEYLLENMEETGITKIECPWFKIGIRKNPVKVNVSDVDRVPDDLVTLTLQIKRSDFMSSPLAYEGTPFRVTGLTPDKTEIKARLQGGEEMEGAELVQTSRVQIS